jgi:hypothetical protein
MSTTIENSRTPHEGLSITRTSQPFRPLWDQAICVILTMHKLGIRRRVTKTVSEEDQTRPLPESTSTSLLSIDTDETRILVTKTILACPEYQAILKLYRLTKHQIDKLVLPSGMKPGVYLIPLDLLEELNAILAAARQALEPLVEQFCLVYPVSIANDHLNLKDAFDSDDYPDVATVREAFTLETQYITWDLPSSLGSVSEALIQQEQQRARTKVQTILTDITTNLSSVMHELVTHLVDRLSPDVNGNAKRFHASTVTNLMEFIGRFNARNLGQNVDLEQIVNQAKQLLGGINPQHLRQQEPLAKALQTGMQQVKTQLDQLLAKPPTRQYQWDDAA